MIQGLPDEASVLVKRLSEMHGPGHLAVEENGVHLYLPCPDCLKSHGASELHKRHLAINLSKFFAVGKFRNSRLDGSFERCAACMKHHTGGKGQGFRLSNLLSHSRYDPISVRMPNITPTVVTEDLSTQQCVIVDQHGRTRPEDPGDVVPITSLSTDHPAIWYLQNRRLSPARLFDQFRLAYCYREAPEDNSKRRWHKRMANGFRDTPQNRIIFYGDIDGSQMTWQARILEHEHEGYRYFFHPYTSQWVAMEVKRGGKWETLFPDDRHGWAPAKYKNAYSGRRNHILLGYDQAIRYNAARPVKFAFVSEGPLDCGRFGNPGVALTGKHIAEKQATYLIGAFDFIIFLRQNVKDSSNLKLAQAVKSTVGAHRTVYDLFPDERLKDFGDTDDSAALHRLGQLTPHMQPPHRAAVIRYIQNFR